MKPTPSTRGIKPTILVIVGITGDLSKRKLLPAMQHILQSPEAPQKLRIVGVTRGATTVREVLDSVSGDTSALEACFEMYPMDLASVQDYQKLSGRLESIAAGFGEAAQVLFYLSIPPQIASPVVALLGESGLSRMPDAKLLLEKPFGVDLASAQELVAHTKRHFKEAQIYRIDHYLAKEMAQNLIVFRRCNPLFGNTWSKDFIARIDIVASEQIGIEGRATFYEQTGALRDLVQSHLLQLAALTLANLDDAAQSVPAQRLQALKALKTPQNIRAVARRAQYAGYRNEVQNADSNVETFVSLELASSDPRWEGVPITLTTGKALDKKATEIRLTYRQAGEHDANMLVLRLQPNEGVEVDLWARQPGYTTGVQKVPLSFAYANHFANLPEAYEYVLLDAIRSSRSLFASSQEVLETWRILEPVQRAWEMDASDLLTYPEGSTPAEILSLIK